jgi:hypothetical protein
MLPFTSDQFFGVFADYNRAVAPIVGALWLTTLLAVAAVRLWPTRFGPGLSYFLAGLWLWNAVAYHAIRFSHINPAAWLFAALFTIQSVLFVWAASHRSVEFFAARGRRAELGLGFIAYGLMYPLLALLTGHDYPATPTFGVPCPTALVTIGLLLGARGAGKTWLSIVPVIWAAIGGSAAVLLDVWPDYALIAGGLVLAVAAASETISTPLITASSPTAGRASDGDARRRS